MAQTGPAETSPGRLLIAAKRTMSARCEITGPFQFESHLVIVRRLNRAKRTEKRCNMIQTRVCELLGLIRDDAFRGKR